MNERKKKKKTKERKRKKDKRKKKIVIHWEVWHDLESSIAAYIKRSQKKYLILTRK